jgi:hypothetical protein
MAIVQTRWGGMVQHGIILGRGVLYHWLLGRPGGNVPLAVKETWWSGMIQRSITPSRAVVYHILLSRLGGRDSTSWQTCSSGQGGYCTTATTEHIRLEGDSRAWHSTGRALSYHSVLGRPGEAGWYSMAWYQVKRHCTTGLRGRRRYCFNDGSLAHDTPKWFLKNTSQKEKIIMVKAVVHLFLDLKAWVVTFFPESGWITQLWNHGYI